jgi:hypothetical protein
MVPENPEFRLIPHRKGGTNHVPSFIQQLGPIREVRFVKKSDGTQRGGQDGPDLDDWLQAEEEILRAREEVIDEASRESFPASAPRALMSVFRAPKSPPTPATKRGPVRHPCASVDGIACRRHCARFGGIIGALAGRGIPEYEAKRYEGRIKEGGILLSVQADKSDWVARAKDVLKQTGAEDISSAPAGPSICRRGSVNSSGSCQPCNGAAWSSALAFCSSKDK